MKTHTLIATLSFVIGAAAACGPPSRDNAVQKSAELACNRYQKCGTLDANYASFGECRADWERRFYDTWPESRCEDIDPEQLDECQVRIETFDCDGGLIDIALVLAGTCSANQVCE